MNKSTNIWGRLIEVLDADNLDEVAKKLDINASTLRGRKARGAVPYDKIVQKLNTEELAYVLKNKKIDNPTEKNTVTYNLAEFKESTVEHFLTGLTKRIEDAPFSKMAKLQIIDSVISIVKQDLNDNSSRGSTV